jgi:transcriptional regulator with GAF, ATPase, and Fis domain
MPKLTRIDDSSSPPQTYRLHKRLTSIGSESSNDIVLEGDEMAATHAVIQSDGAQFEIKTVTSKTSLRVNGSKTRKHVLNHGDTLEFGGVTLEFSLLDEASSSDSTAGTEGDDEASQTVKQELRGYRRLFDFSQRLLRNYELDALIDDLLDAIIDITRADKGFLLLVEDGEVGIHTARNVEQETVPDALEQVSDSIISKVLETREPIIVSDAMSHDEFKRSESVVNLNLSSVMCVPLLDRGELIGLLYVGNEEVAHLFTRRDLDLLTVFAAQASLIVANAIMVRDLRLDREQLSQRLDEMRFGSIIGASDAMQEIFRKVEKVAPTDVTVLVTGETGTGKELVAREIHNRSDRFKHPFMAINCGAIPENLLESELFGHVKGAFTGAEKTRQGKFQAAEGGTVFLDEIGEMPVSLQVKLLRVLQEREVTKVGSSESEAVDIRVIAATNKDLEAAVESGQFREDLYYRLNVISLDLPPLNMRGDDVILIARYYINEICDDLGVGTKELSPEAKAALKEYEWPGNVRQLENKLKKAILLSDRSVLGADDLGLEPEMLDPIAPLSEAKERFAYRYVLEALERNDGNRTAAADELDVDPRTIFRYLEKGSEGDEA